MSETINYTIATIAGLALGVIFFGGLWITVKRGLKSKTPFLLFSFSFILRTAITLIGFYLIGSGNYKNILFCFLGFIIARFLINQMTKHDKQEISSGSHK